MSITRRDFLNGVAITIVAGMAPIDFLRAAPKGSQLAHQTLEYYPPVSSTGQCNILYWSTNWILTNGNDEGARAFSFAKTRALA